MAGGWVMLGVGVHLCVLVGDWGILWACVVNTSWWLIIGFVVGMLL